MQLTRIRRYPVKSCRGEDLLDATVEPWGLAGDRRWMLVDPDGVCVTARECHPLLLVVPEITAYGLRLTTPDQPPLDVKIQDARPETVQVWSSTLPAVPAGSEADAWFSATAGRPLRLVHQADPTVRPTNPARSEPSDRVSLADGYPLLLTTEASLAALQKAVGATPIPMERFRPNLVITGVEAWAEDDWRRLTIGDVAFRAVKGCDRCVLTTLDPDSGEGGKEPIATLARIRRWDRKTWFGINLIPDTPGATLTVGDSVTITEAVPPGNGPLR